MRRSDAAAQNVSTDFDPRVNFSQYKTFMWISPPRIVEDPFMEPCLIDAVMQRSRPKDGNW